MTPEHVHLSYLSAPSVRQQGAVRYVFDATNLTLPLYFALKGKHHYCLENRASFVADIRRMVELEASSADVVVFPESRFSFLREITAGLDNTVELKKRSKLEICQLAAEHATWNREARRSQEAGWAEMGASFLINKVKSNQRKHYVPFLFERADLPESSRVLLLDDFIMSGNTLRAMRAAVTVPQVRALGIFFQLDNAAALSSLDA